MSEPATPTGLSPDGQTASRSEPPAFDPSRSIGERIGSPHFVGSVRQTIIEAFEKAVGDEEPRWCGGTFALTREAWDRVNAAIDERLEMHISTAADACVERALKRTSRKTTDTTAPSTASEMIARVKRIQENVLGPDGWKSLNGAAENRVLIGHLCVELIRALEEQSSSLSYCRRCDEPGICERAGCAWYASYPRWAPAQEIAAAKPSEPKVQTEGKSPTPQSGDAP